MATTRASISAALKLNNSAFKKGLGNSRKELNKFSSSVKSMGAVLGGAFAARSILNFTAEASKLAAQMEGVAVAFERISPSIGFMSELKDATAGTVSELSLMKRAVMASNFKIPMQELGSLMKFATKRAQETGESVDYLVNSIVIGIGRKSPLILDNLGISAVELRKKLDHVGHSGATVGDVAEAVGKIATEEMAKMGDVTETTAIKYERLNAQITDMKVELGNSANVIISKTLPAITAFIDELGVLGRFIQTFWEGGAVFTAEYDRRMEQDIRDNVGRSIEVAKKVVRDKAKELRKGGMGDEAALRSALADQIFSTLGGLARTEDGPWKDVLRDVLKSLQDWRAEIDKFGPVGEAGAETIANLKAEMKALVEIQENLPRGHKDLKDINARLIEIKETIAEIKGEASGSTEKDFFQDLSGYVKESEKIYDSAFEHFKGMADEWERVSKMMSDPGMWGMLDEGEEAWLGGEEAWEKFVDKAKAVKETMTDMKTAIKKELIDSFYALGIAIGETMAGIEGSLKKLAATIASNIGYILMMAGLQVIGLNPGLGAGLIFAGGVLQLGSGIARGLANSSTLTNSTSSLDGTVIFKIAGNDLQAVLDRNSSTVKRFT